MVTTSSPDTPAHPVMLPGIAATLPAAPAAGTAAQPMLDFICRRVADLEKRISAMAEMEQRLTQKIDQGNAAILAELKKLRETAAPAAEKRPMLAPMVSAAPATPWPVAAPRAEEPTAPDICRGEGGAPGQVVLLVDDDAMVRQVTSSMLVKAGYTVDSACGGEAAVRAMTEDAERYGVVLLDLAMPGMNGEQTFRHFRAQGWHTPVIFYSGYGYQLAELFARYGGKNTEFLQKPFEPPQLIERVKRQLSTAPRALTTAIPPVSAALPTLPLPVPQTGLVAQPREASEPPAPATEASGMTGAIPPPLPVTARVPPVQTSELPEASAA